MNRLIGLHDLVYDVIEKTTDLVEHTHESVAQKPIAVLTQVPPLETAARTVDEARRVTARAVFDSVRATNRRVQSVSQLGVSLLARALDGLADASPQTTLPPATQQKLRAVTDWADTAESALNGVMGDFLNAHENGLAIRMSLRLDGRELPSDGDALARALPPNLDKVCVFIHGLACSDSIWGQHRDKPTRPRSFGTLLANDLGYTPLYVRYNTGLHVSQNGRALASLLDQLYSACSRPPSQIVLVGHSMGGLVARSAAHYANALDHAWITALSHVLCIASPHAGAPLERAGNAVASLLGFFDTAGTQVTSQILNARSAGIKDLRYGSVLDEDWRDADPDAFARDTAKTAPFVDGVAYGYVAADLQPDTGPLGELLGDLLVRVPSASGKHRDSTRRLPFHMGHVVEGAHHMALTTHPEVYRQLKRFLLETRAS